MTDPTTLTLTELARAYRTGDLKPGEVTAGYLAKLEPGSVYRVVTRERALEQASGDPAERVGSFVSAFATWHAENHALARVIQYEFKKLPRPQFRQIVEIRARFEELMREELAGGVAAGAFDVEDLEGTTLAVLSLCIDLARWFDDARGWDPDALAAHYRELALRMVGSAPG